VNHFVVDIFFSRGFPLEESSELKYLDNKGIIRWINGVIMLSIFLFLLKIVIKIHIFSLHIIFCYLTSGIRSISSIYF
jgi:hypothetical protein